MNMAMLIMAAAALGVAAVVWWALRALRETRPEVPVAPRRRVEIRVERDVDPAAHAASVAPGVFRR